MAAPLGRITAAVLLTLVGDAAGEGWGTRRQSTTTFLPMPVDDPEPPSSSSTIAASTAAPGLPADTCTELSGTNYALDWEASGQSFFDSWDFLTWDSNNGAAQYLDRYQSAAEHVTEAHDSHAILRVGGRGNLNKRKSAKIRTQRNWKYFLAAVRFTHVPFGCGLWPAFWTYATGYNWPLGGELDVLEYANDVMSQTSLHVGESNRCKLDGALVNKPGCPPMPDLNGMNYDCNTAYPEHLGCGPNRLPLQSPAEWNMQPVTFAIEWTEDFIKIFKIPDYALPQDLKNNAPEPRQWDQFLISYYPLKLSGEGCPNPADVMAPQHLVLNIGLCGDWAGKIWEMSPTCTALHGPAQGCRAVDPLLESDLTNDCCTQFVWDGDGSYGTEDYFRTNGFFNISSAKVFQRK